MPANIHGQMVYSFEKPMWHNITEPSLVQMTAEQVLDERFKGGFEIFLRAITLTLNGAPTETGDFGIVRGKSPYEDSERVFGYCTERFHPLQPREIAQVFDINVNQPAETMGFLGHGEDMFISWKLPSFEIKVGDQLDLFGIVRSGFDTLNGTSLFTAIHRPVCQNTVNAAQGWANANTDGKGKGNIWKGKGVNKNLLRDLGYWLSHVQKNALDEVDLMKGFLGKLAVTPIKNDAEAHEIVNDAYPMADNVSGYYPVELRQGKQDKIEDFNDGQKKIQDGILTLFGGAGTAITPDYYGLFNATSEFFCHVQPSKRPIAESVMFGGRQKQISRMMTVLADRVK